MSDLISRAEAINTVKFYESFCDPYPRVIESLENLPSSQPNNECEKCVFSPFKQFRQSEQQWIPCSERLPEKGKVVLITNEKGNVRCGQYRGVWSFYEKPTEWVWRGNTVETVIAWMPLPKPYIDR